MTLKPLIKILHHILQGSSKNRDFFRTELFQVAAFTHTYGILVISSTNCNLFHEIRCLSYLHLRLFLFDMMIIMQKITIIKKVIVLRFTFPMLKPPVCQLFPSFYCQRDPLSDSVLNVLQNFIYDSDISCSESSQNCARAGQTPGQTQEKHTFNCRSAL